MARKFVCTPDYPVIETEYGKLKGFELDGIFTFYGIDYAKARRFHMPEPVEKWDGIKTATCSALCFYEMEDEDLPEVGEYSVIEDANENAVCIIQTVKVYTTTFDRVSEQHAFKEGEGDRSLDYWRKVHKEFFTEELQEVGLQFDEHMQVVCEEFEVVYPA